MSSYSFHGRAVPKLLAENAKLKPEVLVTKCKMSLCVPCFKSTSRSKNQETNSVTNANQTDGSHASLRYSPSESTVTEMKSVAVESSTDKNDNIAATKVPNGSDVQIRLTPITSTPSQQPQTCSASLTKDVQPETSATLNPKFLDANPNWTRALSVISENELTDTDNHVLNEGDCNGKKKVKFPGISPGISPLGSPRGSVGFLRRSESQEKAATHRKDLSRWKSIRKRISKLTLDPLFDMSITFCILVNTVFLSLEYHGMNNDFRMALDIGNMVCMVQLIKHKTQNTDSTSTGSRDCDSGPRRRSL